MSQLLLGAPPRRWTPRRLPGLALWLDASRIGGLVDGDPVATWSDLSGLGNNATQATGAKRPVWKTNIVNGRAVVRTDGVDDFLQTGAMTLPSISTVIAVLKRIATTGHIWDGAGANTLALYNNAGAPTMYQGQNGPTKALGTAAFRVVGCVYNDASSEMYMDGGTAATGNPYLGASAPNGFTIGSRGDGANISTADYAEIVVCSGVLSAANLSRTFRYLGAKWGVAVS